MNTGSVLAGRPSLGAWTFYGLGSENEETARLRRATRLSRRAARRPPQLGHRLYASVYSRHEVSRRRNADPAPGAARRNFAARQRHKLDFVRSSTSFIARTRMEDDQLEARIASYELAYRMQSAAPKVVDLSDETENTRRLYGLDQKETAHTGRKLPARPPTGRARRPLRATLLRLGQQMGRPCDLQGNHSRYCRESDRPIAGLLKDLKQRGILDSTLVIWGGEFGRTP